MAITSLSDLVAAQAAAQRFAYNKVSQTSEGAGTFHSTWLLQGNPAAGAAPGTTARIPTKATTGAIPFTAGG